MDVTDLLLRRRELMMGKTHSDDNYIQNGLVLWLDGADANFEHDLWIDKVAGKSFTMYNTSANNGGVVFNGSTSYCTGPYISADGIGGTIEVVALTAGNGYYFVYTQPQSSNINMIMYNGRIGTATSRTINMWTCNPTGLHVISASNNFLYKDKVQASKYGTDSFGGRSYTGSYIGQRSGGSSFYNGTLYQIRIYNRYLTEEEVLFNQSIDMGKYNIT